MAGRSFTAVRLLPTNSTRSGAAAAVPLVRRKQTATARSRDTTSSVGRRAHVLEAAVDGERDDDCIRAELVRQAQRRDDVRARRDAREDALLACEAERHVDRFAVFDRPHVVDAFPLEMRRYEAC